MFPEHVFLDTNVFDSQNYNFESAAFKTFKIAATERKIEILLPHPTELEIRRHIKERSAEALEALHIARRKAPFLKKWEHFPSDKLKKSVDYFLNEAASQEWRGFISQFKSLELGYDNVNIERVMRAYDIGMPPFGEGKKRKEFPDALAIAILEVFSSRNGVPIAVVSQDSDMQKACKARANFFSFKTLPELTELLVLGAEQIDEIRTLILANTDTLHDAVVTEVSDYMSYYHERSEIYKIADSSLESIELEEVRVVGMGRNEATLAFETLISTSHTMEWEEQVWDDHWETQRKVVLDQGRLEGTAKVELDPETRAISNVMQIQLDELELAVSESPRLRF